MDAKCNACWERTCKNRSSQNPKLVHGPYCSNYQPSSTIDLDEAGNFIGYIGDPTCSNFEAGSNAEEVPDG